MQDLSHLTSHTEEVPQDSLERITGLAKDMQKRKEAMDLAEANFKLAKKSFNKLSQDIIPEAMMQAGVKLFELDNGKKISYKEELSASVQDYDKLTRFLEDRGDDGMLKVVLELGKTPQNILNSIMQDLHEKYGILAECKTVLHPATLKSYFATLCGIKKDTEAQLAIGDIDQDMVKTFTYFKTTLK